MAEIVPSLLPAIEPIGEPLVMDPPGARWCINGCGAIISREGAMCRGCRGNTRNTGLAERVRVARAAGMTDAEIAASLGRQSLPGTHGQRKPR
jgi:hypothetical protein